MTRSCGWSDACFGDTESRGKNYRVVQQNAGEGRDINDRSMLK